MFVWCLALCSIPGSWGSSSSSVSLASPATAAVATLPSTESNTIAVAPSPNLVVQFASYVKHSVVKTVDGCGQLWKNHGRCNDIRQKLSVHREAVKLEWEGESGSLSTPQKVRLKTLMGGISYEEYVFLQKGKEDRSKVFNLMFLMWGAPRFLPYALMFNPDMLPSPFRDTTAVAGESMWATQSRERSTAVIQALLKIERDARVTPALAKLNIFGKKKQEASKQQLLHVIDTMATTLVSPLPPRAGAEQLLRQLHPHLYREDADFTRAEQRLCHVPKSLVEAMSGLLSGGNLGVLAALQPNFLTRGRVVGHLRKVADSDDFLLTTSTNLTSIPKRYLQEACSERFLGVVGRSTDDLRHQLDDWLVLNTPDTATEGQPPLYYNANVARLALMGYYSCWAARDAQSALRLPRLLFAPRTISTAAARSSHSRAESTSTTAVIDDVDDADSNPLRRFMKR